MQQILKPAKFADAFRAAQCQYGISGRALAEATGIAASTISDIRRGRSDPSCDTLWRLICAMDTAAPGAASYFFQELQRDFQFSRVWGETSFFDALRLDSLSVDELADLLLAVAQSMRKKRLAMEQQGDRVLSA